MSRLQAVLRGAARRLDFAGMLIPALVASLTIALLVRRFEAPIVLAAALFLVACTVIVVRPQLATLLTVFLLYINFPAILTKEHGLPPVVAGSFIVLLGFPILHALIIRRESLKADRTFSLMLALLAVFLLSMWKAVDRAVALRYIGEYVLEGLLLYWLVINVIRNLPELRRVMWAVLAAGGLLGSLSLYQTVTGRYDQEFGGLASRSTKVSREMGDVDREIEGPRQRAGYLRARGPVGQPNRFGQTLVVLVPLAVFMYRTGQSSRTRLAAAGMGMMILAGIALTLSRGSFLCLLLMTGIMMAVGWIRYSRVLVAALILAMILPKIPFFVHRISNLADTKMLVGGDPSRVAKDADGAIVGRATVMMSAARVFLDYPVLGVGAGQFPRFYSQRYASDVEFGDLRPGAWRAHSLYLELAAEVGIVGLTVFLLAVGVVVRGLWRARRYWQARHPAHADLATAFWLSLNAYLITGIIEHLAFQRYYWFLLAISSAAMHILYARPTEQETEAEQNQMMPSTFALGQVG